MSSPDTEIYRGIVLFRNKEKFHELPFDRKFLLKSRLSPKQALF